MTLRLGDKGAAVRALQQQLIALGYAVTADGDFGPATRAAVMRFQSKSGIDADGIVGLATLAALDAPAAGGAADPPWLAAARKELGLKELPGAESEARIEEMFRQSGFPGYKDDTAWCAAFVNAMLARAGIAGTGSLAARSFLNWGAYVEDPQPGDIAVFSRGSNPALGHVAFFLRETRDYVEVLGGNQSDAVTIARYAKSRLLGYRRPRAALVSPVPPPPDVPRSADADAEAPETPAGTGTRSTGSPAGSVAIGAGGAAVAAAAVTGNQWVILGAIIVVAVAITFLIIKRKGA